MTFNYINIIHIYLYIYIYTYIYIYIYIYKYIYMKIPNYDIKKEDNKKRSYNDFINEEYRMLVCSQSGCGKTNTVIHMLRQPLVYYDKIYLYTPNNHQDKIRDLKEMMDIISKMVGYQVMEINGADDILDTCEYQNDNRKVIIFDDLVNAPEKIQSKIANHFTHGRHHNISPIYLTQSYYDTSQKLRQNCSHMIL